MSDNLHFLLILFFILLLGAGCTGDREAGQYEATATARMARALTATARFVSTPGPSPTIRRRQPTQQAARTRTPAPAAARTMQPSPTSTPLPTATSMPTPIPAAVLFTGSGDAAVDKSGWPEGAPGILHIVGPVEGDAFLVRSIDNQGDSIELLVNQGANYEGYFLIMGLPAKRVDHYQVVTTGAWIIEFLPLQAYAHDATMPGSYRGLADDVVFFSGELPAVITFTSELGEGQFKVRSVNRTGRRQTLVNETVPYTGEIIIPANSFVLMIQAPGPWTMEIAAP